MSQMPPERVAAVERLARDAWQLILGRTRDVDDIMLVMSMLLTQVVFNMPDPQRAAEPMLQQINEFVRMTLEENHIEPRTH